MIVSIFLLVLGFLAIFVPDVFFLIDSWQSRIIIGRFQNREKWEAKVIKLSVKWLRHTPPVKLTDNNRLIIIDLLKGSYQRNAIQAWQEAALVLGLAAQADRTNDQHIKDQVKNFILSKTDASGHWKLKPTESDHAILAYAFLNCNFIDHQKYRPAYDQTWQMILSLKGEDGTVAYKPYKKDFRFVDTIGFISPFLVTYGLKFKIPEAVDLGINQILEYQKYGMMLQENIPCHTYHAETKIPTGLYGWGRGLGWWAIGLADSWQALPAAHPAKKELEDLMIKTAHSALKYQEANGGFHWLLFDEGSRLDSSTAATLAWFFTLASEIPEIADLCIGAREKALDYLMTVTRRSGAVDFSQGDTKGIGVYSQNFDILPFTQGFVLRTLSTIHPHQ